MAQQDVTVTVESAIHDSITRDRIALLDWTEELEAVLQERCSDSVDNGLEQEFWGDDDGYAWRVHLVRPEPEPA